MKLFTKSKGFIIFILCTVLIATISVVVSIMFFANTISGYHHVSASPCRTMATVEINGQRGLINVTTNQMILSIEYSTIRVYENWAWVIQDSEFAVFDLTTGEKAIPFGRYTPLGAGDRWAWNIGDGYLKTTYEGMLGVIDIETGEVAIPFGEYDFIGHIEDGFRKVAYDDMWGLIDAGTGEIVIPLGSPFVRSIGGGRAAVRSAGEEALIEIETGEYIIPFGEYDWIHISSYDYNMINVQNRRGSNRGSSKINIETGEVIVPFEPDYGSMHYSRGLIRITSPCFNHHKLMSTAGDVLIPFSRYRDFRLICNETALVSRRSSRGIYNFVNDYYIIPLGIYYAFGNSLSFSPVRFPFEPLDYRIVALNLYEEVGLLCIESGEAIIEFGKFKDIILFENGVVAVAETQERRFRRGMTVWSIGEISEFTGSR